METRHTFRNWGEIGLWEARTRSRMPSLNEWANQIPLCTLAVTTFCIFLEAYVLLFNIPLENFTISAIRVIYFREYYRIISSAVLHANLMHIMVNMMSFTSIGGEMEQAVGTLAMTFIILWSIILSGAIYVWAQWALSVWVMHDLTHVQQRAVGFSGVIFTIALMESHRSNQPSRSVFGMVQVPTRMYPWVLLVLLSLIPGISFMGHLAGILVGVMHEYGVTKPLLPSPAYLIEMENYAFVRDNIAQRHNFVPCPLPLPSVREQEQVSSNLIRQIFGPLLKVVDAARRSLGGIINRANSRGREGGEDARSTPDGDAVA